MATLLHPMLIQAAGIAVILLAVTFALLQAWRAAVEFSGTRKAMERRRQELDEHLRGVSQARRLDQERQQGGWSGIRKFRVEKTVDEAKDCRSFYLVPHDGKAIPMFKPGQYLTFKLRVPNQPKDVVRCYSLSDSPLERNHYRITVKRLDPPPKAPDAPPGVSSNFLHREVHEGDILDVRAPGGHFYLDLTQRRPVVLIAGGVGITPVYSMLRALVDSDDPREIWFFYGLRNASEYCYKEILESIAAEHDNVHLRVCFSNPDGSEGSSPDYRMDQRVSTDLMKQELPSNNYVFHICGPPPMMQSLTEGLDEWGVPEEDVRTEAFGPASVKKTEKAEVVAEAAEATQAGITYQVEFKRSGKTLEWKGDVDNLLEFAEDNGLSLDYGCRAGGCGTCTTAVKSGKFEYVREPDAEADEGCCLACVARPKTDLVLDA